MALLTRRSLHRNDVCNALARSLADCDEHACVVEAIAVTAEPGHNAVADRREPGPLQDGAANEVTRRVVGGGAIDCDGEVRNGRQAWNAQGPHLIHAWLLGQHAVRQVDAVSPNLEESPGVRAGRWHSS